VDHPKYLRDCLKLTDTQNKLISEILEIVALSDGKITPSPEKLDIGRSVADLLPQFQRMAESGGQRIAAIVPDGVIVTADPAMLRKVLSNVILNAAQNTPECGEIRIWGETTGVKCRLNVLNTGIRLDDAVIEKLFDPFYRTDKARGRKDGRSGLGLTISRKTLEAMSIPFDLKNDQDGVLFQMDLPLAEG
jgi:two-component system sensor histidine kinase VanS